MQWGLAEQPNYEALNGDQWYTKKNVDKKDPAIR